VKGLGDNINVLIVSKEDRAIQFVVFSEDVIRVRERASERGGRKDLRRDFPQFYSVQEAEKEDAKLFVEEVDL